MLMLYTTPTKHIEAKNFSAGIRYWLEKESLLDEFFYIYNQILRLAF